jgi:F0F1-type ATP synthase assembly protein I
MVKREQPSSDSAGVPNRGTAVMMLATIADTTWRLFVPVLTLVGLGLYFDHKLDQKPIFGLAGAIIGTVIGFLLVRQQYKRIVAGEDKK